MSNHAEIGLSINPDQSEEKPQKTLEELQLEAGIVITNNFRQEILLHHDEVDIRILPPISSDNIGGELSSVKIQNGGDELMIIDAMYNSEDGKHDLFLIGREDFIKISGVISYNKLSLELAYAIAARLNPDNEFLKNQKYNHIGNEIVEHIINSIPRAKEH